MKLTDNAIAKYKPAITYAAFLALILFLLKWIEVRFIIINYSFELYIGFIAIIFTGMGTWLALKLSNPKRAATVIIKEIHVNNIQDTGNGDIAKTLGISKRELEVLQLMGAGLSNKEIAGKLFVSENTVKTHLSKLYEKLGVDRRVKAVDKAQKLGILP